MHKARKRQFWEAASWRKVRGPARAIFCENKDLGITWAAWHSLKLWQALGLRPLTKPLALFFLSKCVSTYAPRGTQVRKSVLGDGLLFSVRVSFWGSKNNEQSFRIYQNMHVFWELASHILKSIHQKHDICQQRPPSCLHGVLLPLAARPKNGPRRPVWVFFWRSEIGPLELSRIGMPIW